MINNAKLFLQSPSQPDRNRRRDPISQGLSRLTIVLINMGLPPELVSVRDTHKLCVPVAKNGFLPPGN